MKLASLQKDKKEMVNIRLLPSDLKKMREKAAKYTNNNLTAWLKYAGMNMVPKKKDLVE